MWDLCLIEKVVISRIFVEPQHICVKSSPMKQKGKFHEGDFALRFIKDVCKNVQCHRHMASTNYHFQVVTTYDLFETSNAVDFVLALF